MMICLDPYSILEEERDRLRAELAEKEREIKLLKSDIKEAEVVLATERAARKKAEARVRDLEEKIVACGYCEESAGWHNITPSQIERRCERYCPNNKIHAEARAILAARAKEGEER